MLRYLGTITDLGCSMYLRGYYLIKLLLTCRPFILIYFVVLFKFGLFFSSISLYCFKSNWLSIHPCLFTLIGINHLALCKTICPFPTTLRAAFGSHEPEWLALCPQSHVSTSRASFGDIRPIRWSLRTTGIKMSLMGWTSTLQSRSTWAHVSAWF